MFKKNKWLLGIALVCLLASNSLASSAKLSDQVQKSVKAKQHQAVEKSRATIIQEAVSAILQTQKAIKALEKKDKQAALDALAMVLGKLELIMAREPGLTLAPVDVHLETYDLYADVSEIKKEIKKAQELLAVGKVQDARLILSNLASEVDIVITSIPLATYPQAIKKVSKLISQDKLKEAKFALYDLLNTLVVTKHPIPLPILRAEALLKQAKKLAEKKGRSQEESKRLAKLLDQAEQQLKLAQVLGYGNAKDYKAFYAELDKIRKKTSHNKFGQGFFDKIEKMLKQFKDKIFK